MFGPIAGLLAAHRWKPEAAWVLAACDHPLLSADDVQRLIRQRRPGRWAVVPKQPDGHACPTFALFEPQALEVLEHSATVKEPERMRIAELFDHPRTALVEHPARGLFNANTPAEFEQAAEMAQQN